mmetsp:Transcript_34066/g.78566  ORF Transcript_34066/g.78566 Transcript_34066/m.78566 type:complete len:99 (-) Transcript_34066:232-528(-)
MKVLKAIDANCHLPLEGTMEAAKALCPPTAEPSAQTARHHTAHIDTLHEASELMGSQKEYKGWLWLRWLREYYSRAYGRSGRSYHTIGSQGSNRDDLK